MSVGGLVAPFQIQFHATKTRRAAEDGSVTSVPDTHVEIPDSGLRLSSFGHCSYLRSKPADERFSNSLHVSLSLSLFLSVTQPFK